MLTDLLLIILWAVPGTMIKSLALASQGIVGVPALLGLNLLPTVEAVVNNAMRFNDLFPVAITFGLIGGALALETAIIITKIFIFVWGLIRGFRPIR